MPTVRALPTFSNRGDFSGGARCLSLLDAVAAKGGASSAVCIFVNRIRNAAMRKSTLICVGISVSASIVAAGVAISAQDKYTVEVRNGLAFSEFRGYEGWPVIAISENGGKIAVIVGNPEMIDAYKAGVPDSGQPFPDGAKMAKIHWNPKKQETYPGQPTVPVPSMTLISW